MHEKTRGRLPSGSGSGSGSGSFAGGSARGGGGGGGLSPEAYNYGRWREGQGQQSPGHLEVALDVLCETAVVELGDLCHGGVSALRCTTRGEEAVVVVVVVVVVVAGANSRRFGNRVFTVSLHNLMLALGVPFSSHSIRRWPLALCRDRDTYIYLQFSTDCAMCSMRR